MIKLKNYDIMDYGKSMYFGWYATIKKNGAYDGIHADTLRELCAKLGVSRTALARDIRRIDN